MSPEPPVPALEERKFARKPRTNTPNIIDEPHPMRDVHRSRLTDSQIVTLSGGMAGFMAGVIVCPLDVTKTRLQAQGSFLRNLEDPSKIKSFAQHRYTGILKTLGMIWNEEGVRGLYRGLVPITLGYFPTWMIYFTCYENFKKMYSYVIKDDTIGYFASAISSGAFSTTLTNPIWVVKTRLMLQMDNGRTIYDRFGDTVGAAATPGGIKREYYNGTLDAFVKMYRSEGLRSFYRGLLPSYFGLLHVAIQFPLYENFKKIFKIDSQSFDGKYMGLDQFSKLVLSSSMSKILASAVTYPHEIVRTRLQIVNSDASKPSAGLVRTVVSIYKTEGMRGYYAGFLVNLARTLPASAITLVSFEFFKNYLQEVL
ncbi:hypothetical protein OGAPHI_006729 [Ogataea philodendri]|uniref:Mitochondrial NAD+ transporter n=1 Tax=Ogataea philodendri TaxID=1378263 RepID=A0A9P8NXE8_9ASCO|nr:uncharacterized protein OGAPHI_006729 [Ogataea philodendri]KAH3661322.1 hypothetical protein OGAPHI_006729 [Ogataea philodendri]